MRKICYSVAATVDGFIAGPNGEVDWIPMDPEIDFAAIFARYDTLLMGRRTFETAQKLGGAPFPIKQVVVSRTLDASHYPNVTILAADLAADVTRLRAEPGRDIWLFSGGALFSSLLALRLVDTVEVALVPVLLGDGIPLLPRAAERAQLKLLSTKVYKNSGIVNLEYQVRG